MEPQPMSGEEKAIWDTYQRHPGSEFLFRFGRNQRVWAEQGSGRTFSREMFDAMARALMLFVGSRLNRYHNEHGAYPQAITVRLRVAMDAEADDFNDTDLLEGGENDGSTTDETGV